MMDTEAQNHIDEIITRFRDDYFIRVLDDNNLFVLPNFTAKVGNQEIRIRLLTHVSIQDEKVISDRLTGLPIIIETGRTTVEDIEDKWHIQFPDYLEEE